jgi:hypothetical protein
MRFHQHNFFEFEFENAPKVNDAMRAVQKMHVAS